MSGVSQCGYKSGHCLWLFLKKTPRPCHKSGSLRYWDIVAMILLPAPSSINRTGDQPKIPSTSPRCKAGIHAPGGTFSIFMPLGSTLASCSAEIKPIHEVVPITVPIFLPERSFIELIPDCGRTTSPSAPPLSFSIMNMRVLPPANLLERNPGIPVNPTSTLPDANAALAAAPLSKRIRSTLTLCFLKRSPSSAAYSLRIVPGL